MRKRKASIVLIVTVLFFGLTTFSLADEFPSVVKTEYGKIEGFSDANDTVAWLGIPFAKPPVGDSRWNRPKDPEKWSGVLQAFDFCDQCTQYNEYGDIVGSEDCLYLNVWRPDSDEVDLPVYFWIHGGGNSTGSAESNIFASYDGSNMAEKNNVVVVSTNYRLGPLGWFTHPSLRKDKNNTRINDSGNYGTLDIIMALTWVKENIGSFGGDPNNVTIAGESAGGINIYSLMLSPLAAGLFHKAIVESGFVWVDSVEDGDASAERVIDELMANDGILDIKDRMKENQIADYLRSKTAEEILSTYTPNSYLGFGMLEAYNETSSEFRQLFQDGAVIPSGDYIALFLSGQYNTVPIIIGSNEEEFKFFYNPLLFGGGMDPCYYQDLALSMTEMTFGLATDSMAQLLSFLQPDEVYVYRFLYGMYRYDPLTCEPAEGAFNAWVDPRPYGEPFHLGLAFGACHTLDIPFFFGNFEYFGESLTPWIFPDDYSGYELLSNAMMEYTANFVYTGNPGGVDGVIWEPWSTSTGSRILFDADEDEAIIEMVPDLD